MDDNNTEQTNPQGESAGSASVTYHLLSPLSQRNMIMQNMNTIAWSPLPLTSPWPSWPSLQLTSTKQLLSPGRHFLAGLLTPNQSSMERWLVFNWTFFVLIVMIQCGFVDVNFLFLKGFLIRVAFCSAWTNLKRVTFNLVRRMWRAWSTAQRTTWTSWSAASRFHKSSYTFIITQGFPRADTLSLSLKVQSSITFTFQDFLTLY